MFYLFSLFPFCATGEGAASIGDTLTTSFGTVASDALDTIGSILPVALPILGAVIVITLGIKIFRKISGR